MPFLYVCNLERVELHALPDTIPTKGYVLNVIYLAKPVLDLEEINVHLVPWNGDWQQGNVDQNVLKTFFHGGTVVDGAIIIARTVMVLVPNDVLHVRHIFL